MDVLKPANCGLFTDRIKAVVPVRSSEKIQIKLVEKFIALMLKTNFSFNTNIAVWLIKIVLCPLVKGNGFKAN